MTHTATQPSVILLLMEHAENKFYLLELERLHRKHIENIPSICNAELLERAEALNSMEEVLHAELEIAKQK